MANYSESVKNAYRERQSLIILALTGRTGSGCTTVSKILSKKNFKDLDVREPKTYDFSSRDERKYEVVYKYMSYQGRWEPFTVIGGSNVIFSFVVEKGFDKFLAFFKTLKESGDFDGNVVRFSAYNELLNALNELKYIFIDGEKYKLKPIEEIVENDEVDAYYKYFTEILPTYKQEFQKAINDFTCHKEYSGANSMKAHLYTFFMQEVGNNIRSSGDPYSGQYTEKNYYSVAERIDTIISIIKKYNQKHGIPNVRICIDAIRNPYEALYFKDKYSSFYLVSINAEESDRKERLGNLDAEELRCLDEIEYEQSSATDYSVFYHQNMQDCLSISDIHIYNPRCDDQKYYFLTEQILKYICLMLHPGLIGPTQIERCMQTAYIARFNSGCLSRQVGAVITGEDYSVKAIGWNEVPEGQVPCNLRCVPDYCSNRDSETYSSFELKDPEFQRAIEKINKKLDGVCTEGLSFTYCFKDIYNSLKCAKNQVYTRALHAEENAFLQISKNGGQGIKGGKLFVTASPCELCSKKAFQLGIKEIYYIDPYPGIALQHILTFGTKYSPKMKVFYGAIGTAYMQLFSPRLSVKDELALFTGINCKDVVKEVNEGPEQEIGIKDIVYKKYNCCFTFNSRIDIAETTEYELIALHDGIKQIPFKVFWTGSSFNGFSLLACEPNCSLHELGTMSSPYIAILSPKQELKKDESLQVRMKIAAKDSTRIMSPYYAQYVSVKTQSMEIKVCAPKGLIQNAKLVVYAGENMDKDYITETEELEESVGENNMVSYSRKVEKPVLNYLYCIEWTFADDPN